MKLFQSICLALFLAATFGLSSCVVLPPPAVKKDNGKHKGWYKNTNNPHNANTSNPGHTKPVAQNSVKAKNNGKGNGNGKKK